jgi:hypothetical protein
MKKLSIIACLTLAVVIVSCSDIKRKPNSTYMPDMAYSRAYETYADHSNLKDSGINYNNMPVAGTIARGEEYPFPYTMDAAGDTTNYHASKSVVNPFDSLSEVETVEAERIYLVNCGICHGKKLDGNGPLWKDGNTIPCSTSKFNWQCKICEHAGRSNVLFISIWKKYNG